MPAATSVWFTIVLADGTNVSVTKKRMRSLRLRVKPNGEVACSVPYLTTKRAATDFVTSRADWIQTAVKTVSAREQTPVLQKDGAAACAGLSEADCAHGYSAAWKTAALTSFMDAAARFSLCFSATPLPRFTVRGRAMKSLWGSCNRRTNTVTLSWALFGAPQSCIDYVVLHELTHFLHIHHDRAFYDCIAQYMPDYKARIKLLRSLRLSK